MYHKSCFTVSFFTSNWCFPSIAGLKYVLFEYFLLNSTLEDKTVHVYKMVSFVGSNIHDVKSKQAKPIAHT